MTKEECREVFALLSEYIDGDLPPDLCRQMEAHIEGCGPCVEFLESLKRTRELCQKLEAGEKPRPLPNTARDQLLAAYRAMKAKA